MSGPIVTAVTRAIAAQCDDVYRVWLRGAIANAHYANTVTPTARSLIADAMTMRCVAGCKTPLQRNEFVHGEALFHEAKRP